MATPKTPAAKTAAKKPARKPAAKRGPTKAAALKALGLTQADLDVLKQVAAAREAVTPDTTPDVKVQNPEPPVTAKNEAPAPTGFYARNLRNAEVHIRLTRQEKTKKRLELKPRGQRGDLAKLQPEDVEDDELLANVGILVEIITAGEAKDILAKQLNNVQAAVHPAMAMLRNELGQPYRPENIRVEAEFNSQGQTVAYLTPQGGEAGALPSKGRAGVDWAAIHGGQQPQQATAPSAIGGNPAIISDGFAHPDPAAQADAIARIKGLEGPAAGIGGLQVTVDPVQKA
jgi:hypothetical protein